MRGRRRGRASGSRGGHDRLAVGRRARRMRTIITHRRHERGGRLCPETMGVFDEQGFASAWSVNHYLSGHCFAILWLWVIHGDDWVGLFILASGASVFELIENARGMGTVMWTWLGYSATSYHQDSVHNSVSDILFALLGWLVVKLMTLVFGTSTVILGILLGAAGALFAIWAVLFSIERRTVLLAEPRPVIVQPTPLTPFP